MAKLIYEIKIIDIIRKINKHKWKKIVLEIT